MCATVKWNRAAVSFKYQAAETIHSIIIKWQEEQNIFKSQCNFHICTNKMTFTIILHTYEVKHAEKMTTV